MKIMLVLAALAAACKAPKAPLPTVEAPADQNRVERYVGGLQTDVTRAREAAEKANAAIKKTADSQKELQQAEGQ